MPSRGARSKKPAKKTASAEEAAQRLPEHLAAGKFTSLADITSIVLGARSWQSEAEAETRPLTTTASTAELQNWDEHAALVAQRLLKRDESTKLRALQELSTLLQALEQASSERIADQAAYGAQYGAFLGNFATAFVKLTLDPSVRVRAEAVALAGLVVRLYGKRSIALLPGMLPAWVGLLGDPSAQVAEAAARSFQDAFPTEVKRRRALLLVPHALIHHATAQVQSSLAGNVPETLRQSADKAEMPLLHALACVASTAEALATTLATKTTLSPADDSELVAFLVHWLQHWVSEEGVQTLAVPLFRRYRQSLRVHEAFWRLAIISVDLFGELRQTRDEHQGHSLIAALANACPDWESKASDGFSYLVSRLAWDELHASCQEQVWILLHRYVVRIEPSSSSLARSISAKTLTSWLLGESIAGGRRQASAAERIQSGRVFRGLLPFLQALRIKWLTSDAVRSDPVESASRHHWLESFEGMLLDELTTALLWRAPKTKFPPALVGSAYLDWWQAALVAFLESALWVQQLSSRRERSDDRTALRARCRAALQRYLLAAEAFQRAPEASQSVVQFGGRPADASLLHERFFDVLFYASVDACRSDLDATRSNWQIVGEELAAGLVVIVVVERAPAWYTKAVVAACERAVQGTSFATLESDQQPRWSLLGLDPGVIRTWSVEIMGGAFCWALNRFRRRKIGNGNAQHDDNHQQVHGTRAEAEVATTLLLLAWSQRAPASMLERALQYPDPIQGRHRLNDFFHDAVSLLEHPSAENEHDDDDDDNEEEAVAVAALPAAYSHQLVAVLGALAACSHSSEALSGPSSVLNARLEECPGAGRWLIELAQAARIRAASIEQGVPAGLWTATVFPRHLADQVEHLQCYCDQLDPARYSYYRRSETDAWPSVGLLLEYAAWPEAWLWSTSTDWSTLRSSMDASVCRALRLGLWDWPQLASFQQGVHSAAAPWTAETRAWLYVRALLALEQHQSQEASDGHVFADVRPSAALERETLERVVLDALAWLLEDMERVLLAESCETQAPDMLEAVQRFQRVLLELAATSKRPWQALLYDILYKCWVSDAEDSKAIAAQPGERVIEPAWRPLQRLEEQQRQQRWRRSLLESLTPSLDDAASPLDATLWHLYLQFPWTRSWATARFIGWLQRTDAATAASALDVAAAVLARLLDPEASTAACCDTIVTELAKAPLYAPATPTAFQVPLEQSAERQPTMLMRLLIWSSLVRERFWIRLQTDAAYFGRSVTAASFTRCTMAALETGPVTGLQASGAVGEFALELLRYAAASLAQTLPVWVQSVLNDTSAERMRSATGLQHEPSVQVAPQDVPKTLCASMEILGHAAAIPASYEHRADLLTYLRSALELLIEVPFTNLITSLERAPQQTSEEFHRGSSFVGKHATPDANTTRPAASATSVRRVSDAPSTPSSSSSAAEDSNRQVLAVLFERLVRPSLDVFATDLGEEHWTWIGETATQALVTSLGWPVYAAALRCLYAWHVRLVERASSTLLSEQMVSSIGQALWMTCYRLAEAYRDSLVTEAPCSPVAELNLPVQDALGYLICVFRPELERLALRSEDSAPQMMTALPCWREARDRWVTTRFGVKCESLLSSMLGRFWCLTWLPYLVASKSTAVRSAVMQLLGTLWDALEAWLATSTLEGAQASLGTGHAGTGASPADTRPGSIRFESDQRGAATALGRRPAEPEPMPCSSTGATYATETTPLEYSADRRGTQLDGSVEHHDPLRTEASELSVAVSDLGIAENTVHLEALKGLATLHDALIQSCSEALFALTARFPSLDPTPEAASWEPLQTYFCAWLVLLRLQVTGSYPEASLVTPLGSRLPNTLREGALWTLLDGLGRCWIRAAATITTRTPESSHCTSDAEAQCFREQLEMLLAGLTEQLVLATSDPQWLAREIFWEPTDWRPAALGARLLFLTLLVQPLLAQRWFTDHVADRSLLQPLELLSRTLLTGPLIARELEAIRQYAAHVHQTQHRENGETVPNASPSHTGVLSVQGSLAAREILVRYHFEEVQLPVCLRLADTHPWRAPELVLAPAERSVVSLAGIERETRARSELEARYRRLFLHMTRILQHGVDRHSADAGTLLLQLGASATSSSTSTTSTLGTASCVPRQYFAPSALASAVVYWHQRLVSLLRDAPECPICYQVLHSRTGQVSRVRCPTCRYRFHAACLYRWFSSAAHGATCPLCRSPF